jgi:predicted DNA-binding transcriptional regulator AlpA
VNKNNVPETILPELLTIGQVARLLNAGPRTIWRWSQSGVMPRPLKIGAGKQGTVRYRRAEIAAWIESGCPKTNGRRER